MAFAPRVSRTVFCFATSRGARRVLGSAASRPRATPFDQRFLWHIGHPILNASRRCYSGSGGGSSSGQNWDGLVYSIMSNLRGQTMHGPECFYNSSEEDPDSSNPSSPTTPKRRDMREEVPLALNRSYLLETAFDIQRRLSYLAKPETNTEDYEKVTRLSQLLIKLANLDSDNPKLELKEYVEIWMTFREGVNAANDMPLQIVTLNEQNHLKHVRWNAECVWGIATINAAVRRLNPIEQTTLSNRDDTSTNVKVGEEGDRQIRTFEGNLMSLGFKIHGLLLDSKDFWPEGKRWFSKEEEVEILEAVWKVYQEGKRRDF